jgi:hypothetical protein
MSSNDGEGISVPKIIGWFIVALVVIIALGWVSDYNDLLNYKFFGPRREAVRREVYEQTKSYRQGSVQRLSTLCAQVGEADLGHKPMLNDVISHEFAEWDLADVPNYLRSCLATARAK